MLVPSRTGKKTDLSEVILLNVYDSLLPFPTGAEVKALLVVQVFPKSTPVDLQPRLGHGTMGGNVQNGRASLGTVPVEKDGSARFLMPAGKPVYIQALDADGLAIQSMRSVTYVVPGSSMSYYNYAWDFGPVRTRPGEFGARKSRLYPLLKGGHQGVTLSSEAHFGPSPSGWI